VENRLQHFLLKSTLLTLLLGTLSLGANAQESNAEKSGKIRINSELFDVGLVAGIVSIEDFPTEFVVGVNVTFKASEDFFLQYNYVQADVSESAFEKNPAGVTFDLGDDRGFEHYDLLVGYNLFQGEFFASEESAHISSLYIVGGIGDTDIGGEENFTYTLGLGYQIEFFRKYLVRLDYRDYIYRSSLIVGSDEVTVHNNQFTLGIGYLF